MPETGTRPSLADAARAMSDAVQAAATLPEQERLHVLRRLLRADVHDVAMHASIDGGAGPADLEEIAAAIREHMPDGVEDRLSPRVTVFVRLLRLGALEPAWTLANDNASGVVRSRDVAATWAGGSNLTTPLALPTLVDGAEVYAWLPGLRDPRWNIPDTVYSVTYRVVLRSELLLAVFRDGALELSGVGYLGLLEASALDDVTVQLTGPAGARVSIAAQRRRRPGLVKAQGPDLTRLAWGGWLARVDLDALAGRPGAWLVKLSVTQQSVHREATLTARPAPDGPALVDDVVVAAGWRYRLDTHGNRELVLRVGAEPSRPRVAVRRIRRAVQPR